MLTTVMMYQEGGSIDIKLQLRGPLAAKLAEHAMRLNRRPVVLLADIIETVLNDDMVVAILDE